jgi:predicted DNA binding protein
MTLHRSDEGTPPVGARKRYVRLAPHKRAAVRAAYNRGGVTTRDLAAMFNVSTQTISKILNEVEEATKNDNPV